MRRIAAALLLLGIGPIARADSTTPEPAADARFGERCAQAIRAAWPRGGGRLDVEATRVPGGQMVTALELRRSIDERLVHVTTCALPCSRYPVSWTPGVEDLGGQRRPYVYRAGRGHIATVYLAAPEPLKAAAERCLALDGPVRPTPEQRCAAAIESARPALAAIDPRIERLNVSLLDGSVIASLKAGDVELSVILDRCRSACPGRAAGWRPLGPLNVLSDGMRELTVHVEATDAAHKAGIAARLREIADSCLER